jgi:hypothetical protein
MNFRRTLRIATIAASALGVFALTAGPASAAVNPTVATLRVSNGTADFGSGLHANGAPTGLAVVEEFAAELGLVQQIHGTLYVDRTSSGCAGVKFVWKDAGVVVRSQQYSKCGPGGSPNAAANQLAISDHVVSPVSSDGVDTLTVTTGIASGPKGLGALAKTKSVTVSL